MSELMLDDKNAMDDINPFVDPSNFFPPGNQDVPQVETNEDVSGALYDPVDDAILASGGETIPEEEDTTLDSGPADDEAEAEAEAEESDTVEGYRLF